MRETDGDLREVLGALDPHGQFRVLEALVGEDAAARVLGGSTGQRARPERDSTARG